MDGESFAEIDDDIFSFVVNRTLAEINDSFFGYMDSKLRVQIDDDEIFKSMDSKIQLNLYRD